MIDAGQLAEVGGLALGASLKFAFAPAAAFVLGYTFLQAMLITLGGGLMGITFFYFAGTGVMAFFKRQRNSDKKRKAFTVRNKLIVRTKTRFGLIGLVVITPCLISIPVGTLLAVRFFGNDRRTFPYLVLAVLLWAPVMTAFWMFIKPLIDSA